MVVPRGIVYLKYALLWGAESVFAYDELGIPTVRVRFIADLFSCFVSVTRERSVTRCADVLQLYTFVKSEVWTSRLRDVPIARPRRSPRGYAGNQ